MSIINPRSLKTLLPMLIFGATLLFVMLALLITDISDRHYLQRSTEQQIRQQGARLVRLAQLDLQRDPQQLNRELMLSVSGLGQASAALLDPQGKVLFASQQRWLGAMATKLWPALPLSAGIQPRVELDGNTITGWFPYAYPAAKGELASTRRGWIMLSYDLSRQLLERRLDNLRSQLPLLLLIVLAVSLFAYWLHLQVSRPLNRLKDALETIHQGDLDVRVGEQGVLELRSVTRAFDHMAGQLARETRLLREQRDFDHALLQALPALVVAVNREGYIELANDKVAELLGKPVTVLAGQSLVALDHGEQLQQALRSLFSGRVEEVHQLQVRLENKQWEQSRLLSWNLRKIHEDLVLAVGEDVTDQAMAHQRLRMAQTVFDNLNETLMITDQQQRIIAVNPAFTGLMGYREDEVLGRRPALLRSGLHDASFYQDIWDSIQRFGQWQGEIWDRRKDGSVLPLWQSISAVYDEHNELVHYVAAGVDLSPLKKAQDRHSWLSEHDPLTGLLNRGGLQERLQQYQSTALSGKSHGVVMVLNLDRFNRVNEGLGAQCGDELLKEVALRLRSQFTESTELARLAADEFAILLPPQFGSERDASEQARELTSHIFLTLSQPLTLQQQVFHLTASLGVAIYGASHGADDSLPLHQAGIALNAVKNGAGNRLAFFEPGMENAVREAFDLEAALTKALAMRGEQCPFRLYLQPQVSVEDGLFRSFEVLMRWQDAEQGLIPPGLFIPVAERSGLIVPLGKWLVDSACALMATMQQQCLNHAVAINISPRQFSESSFVEDIETALERHQVAPERLILEVTEGLLIDNPAHVVATMKVLADKGIRFSIDDFGTGYSSLAYLKKLPIRELKIDRGFIKDLPADKDDGAIVDTIIAMAKHLKLDVVAEGVETEAQEAFLHARGHILAQGYRYGRPEPAAYWLEQLQAGGTP